MLHKYSPSDRVFILIFAVFAALGIYEMIEFIKPFYGTKRMLACFLIFVSVFFISKSYYDSKYIQKLGQKLSQNSYVSYVKTFFQRIGSVQELIAKKLIYILSFITLFAFGFQLGDVYLYFTIFSLFLLALWVYFSQTSKDQTFLHNRAKENFLFLIVLYFGLLYAVYGMLAARAIEGALANFSYIFVSLVFMFGVLFLYFESFTQRFVAGIMKPYNIMSIGLVSCLAMFLYLQNTSWYQASFPETEMPSIEQGEEIITEKKKISELYTLTQGLSVGSRGGQVYSLQEALKNLGYFNDEITGYFGSLTQQALKDALIQECAWPESTKGIFGPQAQECINNLELDVVVENPETIFEDIQEEEIGEVKKVSELYNLQPGMGVGAVGQQVIDLHVVLSLLGYYNGAQKDNYDEATRVSLRNALIAECEWPESTKGIFGPLAKECIDNLEIKDNK